MTSDSLLVAIADADRWACRLLQQMLTNLGHEVVVVAENGASLLEQCVGKRTDVIITDSLTAEMSELDLAPVVYQQSRIPIILCSNECDRDLVLDAENKHVFMYLVKPINQEHLKVALEGCRHQESGRPSEECDLDEDAVVIGTYAGHHGAREYRDRTRSASSSTFQLARSTSGSRQFPNRVSRPG